MIDAAVPQDSWLRSRGYRTDVALLGFRGEVRDRGEYLVVRSPSNPGYYWGNFLIFRDPPGDGDHRRWPALFRREIGAPPRVRHVVLAWDCPQGRPGWIQPFLDAGYSRDDTLVMATDRPRTPATRRRDLEIRPIEGDGDWRQVLENQVRCRDEGYDEAGYRLFKERQLAWYRDLTRAGRGLWFGAFAREHLVADLGLFVLGGLGRYQAVETHPDHRRQGVASELVYRAGRCGLQDMGARILLLEADEHQGAARLYARLGFRIEERLVALYRWPETDRASS